MELLGHWGGGVFRSAFGKPKEEKHSVRLHH